MKRNQPRTDAAPRKQNRNNFINYMVETTPRLAQWRIGNLATCTYRKSLPFRIGNWNWQLSVARTRVFYIKLYPWMLNLAGENPPIASFVIRLVSSAGDRMCLVHPEVTDKQLKTNEDFVWAIELPLTGRFIIDLEFLDLKISSPEGTYSIWNEGPTRKHSNETTVASLGRMLSESIHTDITINASDGAIHAHRAVLASRSPVFHTMFSHNLREKKMSAVDIPDMSIEACRALLNYMYGNIGPEEFSGQIMALLRAADKYDISDLKEACQESLVEDIDAKNVLERLQYAALYRLPRLKGSCMRYLVNFGKVFDIREDFNVFLQCADRELIGEVLNEILAAWKGF